MVIPNLLLNVNYKDTCGQSSILQHILSYSPNVGSFPQHLNQITEQPEMLWREGSSVVGQPSFSPNHRENCKKENYLELIKECLSDCTDIESNPVLDSDFKFCLPTSIDPGNLMEKHPEQCMYFAEQTGPLYIYDYNVRNEKFSTVIINEEKIGQLNRYYNLDPDTSFNMFLSKMGRNISRRKPSQAANFIKDKPVTLCDMALEHGLDYAIEEGIDIFTNNFLSVQSNDDISEMKNVIKVDINELTTSISGGQEYYKYLCDSLKISANLDLFEEFHDIYVNAVTKERLKIITRSDFLTNILCNEIRDN